VKNGISDEKVDGHGYLCTHTLRNGEALRSGAKLSQGYCESKLKSNSPLSMKALWIIAIDTLNSVGSANDILVDLLYAVMDKELTAL
jgi:hypothetical protein